MTFGQKTVQNWGRHVLNFLINPIFSFASSLSWNFSRLSAGTCFLQVVSVRKTHKVCVVPSLSLWEEMLLFFPSCCFACDGRRSGSGSGCDVGCSLWARMQRGAEARAVSAPLWTARSAVTVTPLTPSWAHFLPHPRCFLSIRPSLSVFAFCAPVANEARLVFHVPFSFFFFHLFSGDPSCFWTA